MAVDRAVARALVVARSVAREVARSVAKAVARAVVRAVARVRVRAVAMAVVWHMIFKVSCPQTYQELILPTDTYLPTSVFCGGSNFLFCRKKLLRETYTVRSVPFILTPLLSFYSDFPIV